MDKLDRRIIQLKIEREACARRRTSIAEALRAIEAEITRLRRSTRTSTTSGNPRRPRCTVAARERIVREIKLEMDARSARATGRKCRSAVRQLPQLGRSSRCGQAPAKYAKKRGCSAPKWPEEIADVVSRATGIPVSKMMQGEREKAAQRNEAAERVVRQTRRCAWLATPSRARGRGRGIRTSRTARSFSWTDGVGKTDSARPRVVPVRFGRPPHPDRHVGVHGEAFGRSPHRRAAGYVGYEEGGHLPIGAVRPAYASSCWTRSRRRTPRVQCAAAGARRRPHDRGQGRTVDFKNTVIVMIEPGLADDPADAGATTRSSSSPVLAEVKTQFRPEFVNRIDEIVVFHALDESTSRTSHASS